MFKGVVGSKGQCGEKLKPIEEDNEATFGHSMQTRGGKGGGGLKSATSGLHLEGRIKRV